MAGGMNGRGQPPTASGRGDLSPAARASGAGLATEGALFHAYRSMPDEPSLEERPCVCGGTVTANPYAPANGVQAHNYTSRHKGWRLAREA